LPLISLFQRWWDRIYRILWSLRNPEDSIGLQTDNLA
jgi:hypothetical protein